MAKNDKTKRILNIYQFLMYNRAASSKELAKYCGSVSKKTVYRDMCLLRQLGFKLKFGRRDNDFSISYSWEQHPRFPENQTQQLYFKKILRLIDMMDSMNEAEDPAVLYRKKYSDLSTRTMQRDFKILSSIGYVVKYVREANEQGERQSNRYYFEYQYRNLDY